MTRRYLLVLAIPAARRHVSIMTPRRVDPCLLQSEHACHVRIAVPYLLVRELAEVLGRMSGTASLCVHFYCLSYSRWCDRFFLHSRQGRRRFCSGIFADSVGIIRLVRSGSSRGSGRNARHGWVRPVRCAWLRARRGISSLVVCAVHGWASRARGSSRSTIIAISISITRRRSASTACTIRAISTSRRAIASPSSSSRSRSRTVPASGTRRRRAIVGAVTSSAIAAACAISSPATRVHTVLRWTTGNTVGVLRNLDRISVLISAHGWCGVIAVNICAIRGGKSTVGRSLGRTRGSKRYTFIAATIILLGFVTRKGWELVFSRSIAATDDGYCG